MLGDGRRNGDQSKEQPFNAIAGQGLGQFLVGFIAQVNARRVAKGEECGLKIYGELAAVQFVHVGHQHEGRHQVKAADDAVAVHIRDSAGQAGIGAIHAGVEDVAGGPINERLVYAGVEGLAQILHHVNDNDGRGKEKEGDEAVGEQLAGVYPAVGGHDIVQGVPEPQSGQGQDEHAAQGRR